MCGEINFLYTNNLLPKRLICLYRCTTMMCGKDIILISYLSNCYDWVTMCYYQLCTNSVKLKALQPSCSYRMNSWYWGRVKGWKSVVFRERSLPRAKGFVSFPICHSFFLYNVIKTAKCKNLLPQEYFLF